MRYVFTGEDQDSIAARLTELYTLPSRIFKVPVPDGEIAVKIRLLTDQEQFEVAKAADIYGPLARVIMQRRHILARAVEVIEGGFIDMPKILKQDMLDRTGKEPSRVEEQLWVLERCQGVTLQVLIDCYEELRQEQQNEIAELKKKSVESRAEISPETM